MNAGTADILFCYKTLGKGGKKILIGAAAVYIAARLKRHSSGFGSGSGNVVMLVKVLYGPAVGNEIAIKSPAFKLLHKSVGGAGGLAVYSVVSAHYALNPRFLNKGFKGGKIGFLKLFF